VNEDLSGYYLRWINDSKSDEFTEHAQFPHRVEDLKMYAQSKQNDSSCVWLAIVENGSNRHIGNIELCNIDLVHRKCEFKILIDKSFQGKGYGEEASRLILRYGFKTLNIHRVYLGVHENNKKAINLYKKLGFVEEGILRESFLRNDVWKNSIVMGMLSNEFKDKQAGKQ
jgi:RimJ/RimL family protein N-acetyltransferase